MEGNRRERRRSGQHYRGRPRTSPASLIVLTIAGVLLATAAASVIFGERYSEATPHGRMLLTLQEVAEAQEDHHRRTDRFTWRSDVLDVAAPDGLELSVLQADTGRWQARVSSREHRLSCSQSGRWEGNAPVRDEPVCYRDPF